MKNSAMPKTLCPHCDAKLNVKESVVGMKRKCPACRKSFTLRKFSNVPGGSAGFGEIGHCAVPLRNHEKHLVQNNRPPWTTMTVANLYSGE